MKSITKEEFYLYAISDYSSYDYDTDQDIPAELIKNLDHAWIQMEAVQAEVKNYFAHKMWDDTLTELKSANPDLKAEIIDHLIWFTGGKVALHFHFERYSKLQMKKNWKDYCNANRKK